MPGAAPRLRRDCQGDKIRRTFDRVAPDFAAHDFLYREMARRMAERLDMVRLKPARILDAGCGLGADRLALQQRYPEAEWLGLDLSEAMLRQGRSADQAARGFLRRWWSAARAPKNSRLVASLDAVPLATHSVDLVWSNAALHWLDDLPATFRELHRVLGIGGLLMFSVFGPDTLKELRQALSAVDARAAARMQAFTDMHDIGDMLVHAGFSDPVMDMETLTLTYADPWQALRELQRAGSVSAQITASTAPRGLTTRCLWDRVFECWPRDADGRYPLTFELVQGHAWKAAPRQHEDGRAVVNFMPRPGQSINRGNRGSHD